MMYVFIIIVQQLAFSQTTGSFTVELMDCLNPLKVKKFASASVPGETTKSEVISGYGRVDRVDMKAGKLVSSSLATNFNG
ncbi:hypothetical protein KFK09_024054 [Dendrobium nobile]|uniref:Uncharacterized protein n=1 Tax=Dendrobium nobile TaxID=94219 RepID=A0A8T3ABY7_DENNO|nr:hypothetical protein KFK09_024054 [Dendrobium nobile]